MSKINPAPILFTDAENALQVVWLVVWRKAQQFDPALASARTWIFTLARNRLIDVVCRMSLPRRHHRAPQV